VHGGSRGGRNARGRGPKDLRGQSVCYKGGKGGQITEDRTTEVRRGEKKIPADESGFDQMVQNEVGRPRGARQP